MLDSIGPPGATMTKTLACVLSTCVVLVLVAGAVIRARAAQDGTAQPGQPTQARVWVQNRGDAEAVPVTIQAMAIDVPPLRVQVVGPPMMAIGAPNGQARAVRQPWEYQNVTIPSGQDPAATLNAAGADGWEATGVAIPVQGGILVVTKRPR
jgi:hypothetical protein